MRPATAMARSVALGNRGWILLDAGRLDEALDCYQRALRIQEELGNKWEVARHRASIASIWAGRNDLHQALVEYQRALPVLRDHGARFYLIDPLLEAAHLLVDLGKLAAARELANEGGPLAVELGLEDRAGAVSNSGGQAGSRGRRHRARPGAIARAGQWKPRDRKNGPLRSTGAGDWVGKRRIGPRPRPVRGTVPAVSPGMTTRYAWKNCIHRP